METTTMNSREGASYEYEGEVDLRRYRRFAAAHWMLLAACAVGGAVVSIGFASYLPARYQATATLLIVQPTGSTPLVLTPATAKALLVNPPIVSEAINELGLNRQGITAQGLIDGPLEVEPVSATNLVKLSVTLSDPSTARQIASLLATKAVELMNRVERDAPSAERPALEKQLNEAGRRVEDTARRLVDFQTNENIDALDAEIKGNDRRRAAADGLRIRLEGERARLSTLQQELARQTDPPRAGQNAPGVRDADSSGSSVHSLLQNEIALSRATVARLESEHRETLAIGAGRDAASRRAEFYRRKMELDRLKAEYDARTRTYSDIQSRYERPASVGAQLYVVAAPAQPDQPLPRRRRQFASLGAIVGLVCGIGIAMIVNGPSLSPGNTR